MFVVTTAGEKITKVAAGEIMDDVCPEGCTLILGDKGEVIVTADDSVTIENGTMTLD
ncbi:MAG: hypothetical protein H8E36_04880 [Rhodospirillaceae bacterium]|nr:hypothetical protein [Rhodospirillaceae bacterium]